MTKTRNRTLLSNNHTKPRESHSQKATTQKTRSPATVRYGTAAAVVQLHRMQSTYAACAGAALSHKEKRCSANLCKAGEREKVCRASDSANKSKSRHKTKLQDQGSTQPVEAALLQSKLFQPAVLCQLSSDFSTSTMVALVQ